MLRENCQFRYRYSLEDAAADFLQNTGFKLHFRDGAFCIDQPPSTGARRTIEPCSQAPQTALKPPTSANSNNCIIPGQRASYDHVLGERA
eukprot:608273-Amphidinium_carterae.1